MLFVLVGFFQSRCGSGGFLVKISYTTSSIAVYLSRSEFSEWPTLQRLILPMVYYSIFTSVTSITFVFIQGYNCIKVLEVFVDWQKSSRPIYCHRFSPPVVGFLNALLREILSVLKYIKLFVQVWVVMWYFLFSFSFKFTLLEC